MSVSLSGWDHPAPPGDAGLLDEAPTAVLPLAAYANGFDLIVRGNYVEAIASLRRAADVSDDERDRLVHAGLLNQEGRVVEAEQALRSVLDAWPDSALSRWWLGRIYDALDRVVEARRQYEAVLPVALGGRGHIYAAIGRLARRQGDFDAALEALRRRTQVSPKDPAAHKDLARVLIERDRSEEAITEFAAVLKLDPSDAESHAAIGRIHLDAGRPAEAIPAFRRAITLMPERHETRYALAMALKQTGQAEEAARELQLFERASRESVDDRRRTIAADVKREEAALQGTER
jgi:tetratricopeptide (TPR) repeat protein